MSVGSGESASRTLSCACWALWRDELIQGEGSQSQVLNGPMKRPGTPRGRRHVGPQWRERCLTDVPEVKWKTYPERFRSIFEATKVWKRKSSRQSAVTSVRNSGPCGDT